jgi:hypothetical protein
MTATIHAQGTVLANSPEPVPVTRKGLRRTLLTPFVCSVLASIGIFGGMSALFTGIMCVILHGVLSQDIVFNRVGTVLLIVAIPMILIGAIFLDEIELRK